MESFLEVQRLNPLEVHLGEEIAEGGEAHIYLASCRKFNMPAVVKVFKRHLNLLQLQRQMEKVMRVARKRSSAICRVMGVGDDYAGKPWVLMERMGGDLRDLLDTGMHYVKDGQMPFHYTATIKMMMEIAQGMEDLHRCGLIHEELKASNIFVAPLMLDSFPNGLEQVLVLIYFYINIGDYESLDGVIGTGFWRPPEVLHALKDGVVVPIPTPAGDVYTLGYYFYELLTGNIHFHGQSLLSYDMVLSGQRPELPTHRNSKMHELLHSCWQADPQQRPGWTKIKETLRVECESHPSGPDHPLYSFHKKLADTCRAWKAQKVLKLKDQTFEGDMESVVEVENQRVGSSSTGLLGMQGVEASPAKVEKLLSIHDKAQEKVPAWIVKAGWQNVHRGHHRLNCRVDLTHDSPPFHEIALAEIEYLEVAIASRTHNTIAAVARNPALESWVPDSPAPSKAWEVAKVALGLKNSAACEYSQMSFEDWQAANPAGFEPWWKAVTAASEA